MSINSLRNNTESSCSADDLPDKVEDNEIQEYEGFDTAKDDIQKLAKVMSHLSREQTRTTQGSVDLIQYLSNMSQVEGMPPYANELNEKLNPESDLFEAKLWVKNLKMLHDSDLDYYKPSSLCVTYRNLTASGISTDSDFGPLFSMYYLRWP